MLIHPSLPPRSPLEAKNIGPSSSLAVGLCGSKGDSISTVGLPPSNKLMDCGPQGSKMVCPNPLLITVGDVVFGTNALNPVSGPSSSASPPVSWASIVGQNQPQGLSVETCSISCLDSNSKDGHLAEPIQTVFSPSCFKVSTSGTKERLMSIVQSIDQCRSPCLDNIDSRIVPLGKLASQVPIGNVDSSPVEQQIGPPDSHPLYLGVRLL
ncbi:hypothetical protein Nepgr_019591 [Nepenthes gracilis]|uniref:Uncharacterized protein n=1 Tax=Nepenthes gracilis TaxID=150966 RepID=A0AAD3STU5_NEPGR|nr:hypothetical protein Nepgr_019591 [Nepenthes gracilis]